eukprot:gnl/TRDRNA2_/TRDRNA2_116231_c0_seq1.p1 gnl/TRDRNA2_/TRDRNA2_116231_c0~~gnl/TRDRNA2_/TRDRNA2_116231_c0_seq1.p1  ORF type:complete len:215 (+),score=25.58 gnl/TRDRNA2_/TRDRNA2_116231_c0_seq1:108-752(+)
MGEFHDDAYHISRLPLANGGLVLDVGANVGVFSIVVAKIFPHVRIVGFEPQPLNFLLASHNIVANGLQERVKIVNQALTFEGTEVVMDYSLKNIGASQGIEKSERSLAWARNSSDRFVVSSTTWRQVLDTYAHSGEAVILKLDCECCEYNIYTELVATQHRISMMRGEIHQCKATARHPTANDVLAFFKHKDPTFVCSWCQEKGVSDQSSTNSV